MTVNATFLFTIDNSDQQVVIDNILLGSTKTFDFSFTTSSVTLTRFHGYNMDNGHGLAWTNFTMHFKFALLHRKISLTHSYVFFSSSAPTLAHIWHSVFCGEYDVAVDCFWEVGAEGEDTGEET
jgi:hypothetical protein